MKVIYLEWVDAVATGEWTDISPKNFKMDHCKAIGFLIHESDDDISLACTVSDKQANAIMTIPKAWVKRRKMVVLDGKKAQKKGR